MASTPQPDARKRALHPIRRTIRYWASRLVVGAVTRAWMRLDEEGFERLPGGPAIYCFNHLSWADPFALMATENEFGTAARFGCTRKSSRYEPCVTVSATVPGPT